MVSLLAWHGNHSDLYFLWCLHLSTVNNSCVVFLVREGPAHWAQVKGWWQLPATTTGDRWVHSQNTFDWDCFIKICPVVSTRLRLGVASHPDHNNDLTCTNRNVSLAGNYRFTNHRESRCYTIQHLDPWCFVKRWCTSFCHETWILSII